MQATHGVQRAAGELGPRPRPGWGPPCSGHGLLTSTCCFACVSRHRTFSRPENSYALQFGIFDKDLQERVMQTYSRETYSPQWVTVPDDSLAAWQKCF